MVSNKAKLTAKKILEQEFKVGVRGYRQEEVDKYLDVIIKDYEAFHKEIEELRLENAKLKKMLEEQRTKPSMQPVSGTNPDILRRLSNLEKHVFGNKLYD